MLIFLLINSFLKYPIKLLQAELRLTITPNFSGANEIIIVGNDSKLISSEIIELFLT